MAPIPNRFPEETRDLISSTERRYNHLNDVEVPKLRKCPGPLSLQQSLAEELREDTVLLTRQIEELEMMVDDLSGEKNRRDLRAIVDDFKLKLDRLRKDTRAALLTSKRAIDSKSKSNKDELLAFAASQEKQQTSSEKITEDSLMKANSDVTDALRRTIALMQSELERSVLTTQLLDTSTTSLRATSLQHDALSGVMSVSKQLITALEKSDWLDRLLILSGFAFFILVVLFILKQRILDRGLRIAFWWTRFIPDFSDDAALLKSAEKGVASAVVGASSVAASLASSLVVPVATVLSSALSASVPEPTHTADAYSPIPTPLETVLDYVDQSDNDPSPSPEHTPVISPVKSVKDGTTVTYETPVSETPHVYIPDHRVEL